MAAILNLAVDLQSRYICSAAWNVDYGISPELHSQGLVDRHAL
jgi:hypothetical protein